MQELISKIRSKRLFAFAGLLWFLHDMSSGVQDGTQRLYLAGGALVGFLLILWSYVAKDDTSDDMPSTTTAQAKKPADQAGA